MLYRRDIEGLRGLAVLCVLVYHVGISAAAGGFLGVDIFFVISGYLITGRLAVAAADGQLDIRAFWVGRIRRLWPALAATLIVSGGLAYVFLYPSELQQFARGALAAAAGVSNIYFYLFNTDYFQASMSGTNVLLHTWTLGVEAQFYVLLPILLLLYARGKVLGLVPLLLLAAAASLAFSLIGTMDRPGAFYLLPARMWEFLVGSLLAVSPWTQKAPSRRSADIASILGVGAIAVSVCTASEQSPIIGVVALAPCLATAALIWAGQNPDSLAARALTTRPMVGLGKISYSVYLWHWPIIVFLHTLFVPLSNQPFLKLAVIGFSMMVGYLSWRFIELPFRYGPRRPSNGRLLATSGLVAGSMAVACVGMIVAGGLPNRFQPGANRMQAFLNYNPSTAYRQGSCYMTTGSAEEYDRAACLDWDDRRPNVLLLGDSHGAHLWYGLSKAFPEANIMQATASGCRPLYETDAAGPSPCKTLMKSVYDDYLRTHDVEAVLLAGRWQAEDLQGLEATLDWAKANDIRVILIGPIVEYDSPLPRLLAGALQQKRTDLAARHQSAKPQQIDRALSEMAARHGVGYVSLWQAMCRDGSCVEVDDRGEPIQFDYGHLTQNGSMIVGELIRSTGALHFGKPGAPPPTDPKTIQNNRPDGRNSDTDPTP